MFLIAICLFASRWGQPQWFLFMNQQLTYALLDKTKSFQLKLSLFKWIVYACRRIEDIQQGQDYSNNLLPVVVQAETQLNLPF